MLPKYINLRNALKLNYLYCCFDRSEEEPTDLKSGWGTRGPPRAGPGARPGARPGAGPGAEGGIAAC